MFRPVINATAKLIVRIGQMRSDVVRTRFSHQSTLSVRLYASVSGCSVYFPVMCEFFCYALG